MTHWLARRAVSLVLTLLAASLVIFMLIQVLPGDPARLMLGLNASPEALASLRTQMGLDAPLPLRYLHWLGGLFQGNFGLSYTYRVPVGDLIAERLAVSLPLALYALAISIVLAFPIAVFAAARRGRAADMLVMGGTQIGIAIPNFWLGVLLVLLFSTQLHWFSAGGFPGWQAGILPGLKALTLPALALGLPQAAILARVMRAALVEALAEDYVRTARAKGLNRSQVIWRHGVRNALIPVLTIIGMQLSFLLAGSIIIENVFFLPGLGRLVYQAILQRDLMVVQGVVMVLVLAVVMVTFLVDIAYHLVDPRLRRPVQKGQGI